MTQTHVRFLIHTIDSVVIEISLVAFLVCCTGQYDDAVIRLQSALSWNKQHQMSRYDICISDIMDACIYIFIYAYLHEYTFICM